MVGGWWCRWWWLSFLGIARLVEGSSCVSVLGVLGAWRVDLMPVIFVEQERNDKTTNSWGSGVPGEREWEEKDWPGTIPKRTTSEKAGHNITVKSAWDGERASIWQWPWRHEDP